MGNWSLEQSSVPIIINSVKFATTTPTVDSPSSELELLKSSLRSELAPEGGLGKKEGMGDGGVEQIKENDHRSDMQDKLQGRGTLNVG